MGSVLIYFIWLGLSIWAAFIVAQRIENRRDRIAYYLAIWLIPIIGAAVAVFLSRPRASKTSSSEKMFNALVDAHRRNDSI
ncbi:hypothetical protein [Lentisalinibacter salinarum]|uniref:hypothetical protein n=3 Tax=Lentisalinibacter salinarum TaxID=2992239 RepID=UPI003865E922